MEKNLPRVSRKDGNGTQEVGASSASSTGQGPPTLTWKSSRYDDAADRYGGGDPIDCSGKYCRSCTAGLIADCVAICCCPCAVVNLLTLALVKVPWKMGRRCLGLGKKKRKKLETKRKGRKSEDCGVGDRNGDPRRGGIEEGFLEILSGFDGEEEMCEVEKVWLDLYEVGQLGFGRVSFTGG
ncbi:hypothetical protein SLEP1_g45315 [Rubroshorea leprosula]|uniref:Uncharacterized protein n=1 Tax=Rubroshorea leprosula TaxID=152421 RepID=A0AAV5LIS8_9ROSI|nr:hypothetical protein SLEP1_g45315 [Rubroshorea leprosula]